MGKKKKLEGHTLMIPTQHITRQALPWNSRGRRKRGRRRNSWHREVKAEMRKAEYKRKELEAQGQSYVWWKGVVDGLYSARERKGLSQIHSVRQPCPICVVEIHIVYMKIYIKPYISM